MITTQDTLAILHIYTVVLATNGLLMVSVYNNYIMIVYVSSWHNIILYYSAWVHQSLQVYIIGV